MPKRKPGSIDILFLVRNGIVSEPGRLIDTRRYSGSDDTCRRKQHAFYDDSSDGGMFEK